VYKSEVCNTYLIVTDNLGQTTSSYMLQYYPGSSRIAKRRRDLMMAESVLEKYRDIFGDDLIDILGHRVPGSSYPSAHPPLSDIIEPECPVREVVTPTLGAAAGDRIRYVQWVDSMYNAPSTPYWRSYHDAIHYRGIDLCSSSGRQIVEARERDLELIAKEQLETDMFCPGLSAIRGCSIHGHSLRLQEDGVMFDMLDRRRLEGGFNYPR